MTPASTSRLAFSLLVAALWLGLLCGLVEGAGFLVLQRLQWLSWNMALVSVTGEIVRVAIVVDLLLFGGLGLLGLLAARMLSPRWFPAKLTVGAMVFLLFLDWLALSGRIRLYSATVLALGLATVFARWWAPRAEAVLRFWRRTLPILVLVAIVLCVLIEGGARRAERRATAALPDIAANAPNVLVIVIDTLRADHLSSYGYARGTSPQIDRVAAAGVLFEKAITTSAWTLPAHISLLTGQHPYENGRAPDSLGRQHPTLGEFLQGRGYRTAAFSANTFFFTRSAGFARGFHRFEDTFRTWQDSFSRTLYGRQFVKFVLPRLQHDNTFGRTLASEVTDSALAWIGSDSRPFFAFLNYFDVHDPYVPPQPFRSKFSREPAPGGRLQAARLRHYPELTPEQLQAEVAGYDGAIAFVDHHIGRLLAGLEEKGLAERTIVVIVSDHGEMLSEHGLFFHRNCLYRPVVHVPLIVRWPGQIPAGLRVPQPVSIASLPATLAEMVAAQEVPFPGPSLAALWRASGLRPEWPLPLAEQEHTPFEPMKGEPSYDGVLKSVVNAEWQFILHEKLGAELYHWGKDPSETRNAATAPEGRVLVEQFSAKLQARLAQLRSQHRSVGDAPR